MAEQKLGVGLTYVGGRLAGLSSGWSFVFAVVFNYWREILIGAVLAMIAGMLMPQDVMDDPNGTSAPSSTAVQASPEAATVAARSTPTLPTPTAAPLQAPTAPEAASSSAPDMAGNQAIPSPQGASAAQATVPDAGAASASQEAAAPAAPSTPIAANAADRPAPIGAGQAAPVSAPASEPQRPAPAAQPAAMANPAVNAPGNLLDKAKTELASRDYARAQADLQQFLVQAPTSPDAPLAAFWLGQLLSARGQNDQAVQLFSQSITGAPGAAWTADAKLHLAMSLTLVGRHFEACRVLDSIPMIPATAGKIAALRQQAACSVPAQAMPRAPAFASTVAGQFLARSLGRR